MGGAGGKMDLRFSGNMDGGDCERVDCDRCGWGVDVRAVLDSPPSVSSANGETSEELDNYERGNYSPAD